MNALVCELFVYVGLLEKNKQTANPAINRNDIKLPPECSSFNPEQNDNDVLLRYLDRIFVPYGIPEWKNITLTGKIA